MSVLSKGKNKYGKENGTGVKSKRIKRCNESEYIGLLFWDFKENNVYNNGDPLHKLSVSWFHPITGA